MRIGPEERRSPVLRALLAALFLPFLLASLLPAAVMPARGAEGGLTVILCSGQGPVAVTLGADGGPVPDGASTTCDWAAAQPGPAILAAPALPAAQPAVFAAVPAAAPLPAWVAAAPAAPLARGPPLPA